VRVKQKLQWRTQEARDVRNVGHLPKKAMGSRQSQCRRKAIEVKLPKPCRAHILTPYATNHMPQMLHVKL
jgi:hypothetical protein